MIMLKEICNRFEKCNSLRLCGGLSPFFSCETIYLTLSIIEKISDNITDLVLPDVQLKRFNLNIMLSFFQNLQHCNIFIWDAAQDFGDYDLEQMAWIDNYDMAQDLISRTNKFNHLKTLQLDGFFDSNLIKSFAQCTSLESLGIDCMLVENSVREDLRKLIFASDGLKTLKLKFVYEMCSLEGSNIQLETLQLIDTFFKCPEDVWKFFNTQTSLKSVEFRIYDIVQNEAIMEMLKRICQLPNLKHLKLDLWMAKSTFEHLKGIVNKSVVTVYITYAWEFEILKTLNDIFPNLKKIYYRSEGSKVTNVMDFNDLSINLDKLHIIKDCIKSFYYQPTEIPVDVVQFEESLKSFLLRHDFTKSIEELTVGHECWMSNASFKLSMKFCTFLVKIMPELKTLKLYNVAYADHLQNYFEAHPGKMENITLYTAIAYQQDHCGFKIKNFTVTKFVKES
jgi:hypothetical protein